MSDHRWRGYPHEQLHTMINGGPGVSASHEMETGWKNLADSLTRIDDDLNKALGKLGADWEGSTADAATTALSPLAQWAADASQGSDVMKSSATIQADNIADARKKMPEPVKVTTEAPSGWDMALGAMTGPFGAMDVINQQQDHERQEAAQDNAQQQAIKVMEDYESESTWNRETLGEFNEPPQVVVDTPPPSGTTDPNANVGYQGTSKPGQGNGDTTNTSWTAPPTGTTTNQPPPLPPTDTTKPSWLDPKPQPPVTPPTTFPPGGPIDKGPTKGTGPVVPPIFTRPDGSGAGRGPGGGGTGRGPGGPGGGKAFGSMSGALGGGGKAGMSAMGPGGMAGAMDDGHHANRGAAAGAAGKAGAAGGMGAGAGAGRGQGQGEDDIEHQTADYLVETEDVFGDERLVAPPVIGGAPEA